MQKKKVRSSDTSDMKQVVDFSTVLWHGADLSKLKMHLIDNIDLISTRPERSADTISRLLSRRIEVREDELLVTSGSTGAIHLLAKSSSGSKSLIIAPTHQEFRTALNKAGHTVTEIEGCADVSKLPLDGIQYCWLCTPNITDGRLWSRASLISLIKENPNVTFIVDISMASFVVEETLRPSDVKTYKNLIIVSSFSKAYNIPGMRVGYIVARKNIITDLKEKRTPCTIGALAVEAIRFILIHPAQFTLPARKWHRSATELKNRLTAIDGIEILPSATAFFVVRLLDRDAVKLNEYLMEEYNMKVGVCTDGLDLKPNEFRVSALDNESNKALAEAISNWMKDR
ncbi:aminotransferase class I/II-fold pyridoxal phosphate-dependent enzyme [Porphyromonas sp.]|uniref:aminotransferase class I/II-fold pyridoxal phosphate-dependent enzyme n=1 Tax=Porphyromonas sp. TaxID=1924944 RepID=UPI0026DCAEE5|nr:aminotransferase class I/II-fold pyridoxal phosphate-dependent enzyme [Porphyromonas sp.]MDO4695852.1 aminotransferase class I/II-fold pyridoxal phosphate-dependent enzyme [Porphyromonas sp.]MDO4770265.1 aminotransferase class I/II-fold pyridoxal phosphate-dependent enzyme [Porphyromonas sp.]